jgi:dCMP deaminase
MVDKFMQMIDDDNQARRRWDIYFLNVAERTAALSKDPSTKVGAVIVDPRTRAIVSQGFNGFPRGVKDLPERYNDRDLKLKLVVHAEANAVLNAPVPVRGMTLYVWPSFSFPAVCHDCAKTLVQAGIAEIVSWEPVNPDPARLERWRSSLELAGLIASEGGIRMRQVSPE